MPESECELTDLFSVAGKAALITGGSSGIGYMIASGLVKAGARTYIVARREPALQEAAERLGEFGQCIPIQGDVATGEGVDELVARLKEKESQLDILINNAGMTWGKELESFPDRAWPKVMALNVQAPFMLVQRLLPLLGVSGTGKDPARVINIGSIFGVSTDIANAYSYAASKAAIHQLTRVLAKELAPRHITVNAVAPGLFPSQMTAFWMEDEAAVAELVADIPAGRFGVADDAAGLVLWLTSRAGSYVTGAVIPLDGGRLLSG